MVDSTRLLSDLTKLLRTFDTDLREQVAAREDVRVALTADYQAAREAGRTTSPFDTWVEEPLTQAAVAWILGTVFVRFLEDNALIEPRLSGSGGRRTRAMQEHQHYFQQNPTASDRDYLESLFSGLLDVPATAPLFDRRHNPLWRVPISADAARALVEFWQRLDPDSGEVSHQFQDETLDTRFLGDLYQDLSEDVRKRYALLQTPRFVEAFILDRTLTPAIETFGYREVTVIDPTCGSGHFLLGAFDRLLDLAQTHEPGRDVRALVQDVLSRVAGIDINPYAVAISRFRLMVAAIRACGITRLADAPGFETRVAAADSLLHGPRFAMRGLATVQPSFLDDGTAQYYFAEDEVLVRAILGRQYHAVVGNPPYITVKDAALNKLYRHRFQSCSGKYALVVPFMERFFELAVRPDDDANSRAGFVGMIVANSFMKREFGKKVIEEYLPRWDLTHVVDTSGAYIPGHGTPTVLLFGRNQAPQSTAVRVVMGIRGEPSTPPDPAHGQVWGAIVAQIGEPGSESQFVSVSDVTRATLHKHPWSIGGGGAAELKEFLDSRGHSLLGAEAAAIGITSVTGEDDIYLLDSPAAVRRLHLEQSIPVVTGDVVRDWSTQGTLEGVWVYAPDYSLCALGELPLVWRHLWGGRATISRRKRFGVPMAERGLTWYEWQELYVEKLITPLSIAFAEVATHNHFVLDRGGKVFKQTAPVIKLPVGSTEDRHLELLALLNSSTSCFWLKQVCQNKGSTVDQAGARQRTAPFEDFFQFNATKLLSFPVAPSRGLAERARQLSQTGEQVGGKLTGDHSSVVTRDEWLHDLAIAIALQEELDWSAYQAYGLTTDPLTYGAEPPPLELGQRAFEIVMARKMAAGELETTWFARHGSTPITELPAHWPDDYRRLVERRIELIENDRYIGLIEQPEYKRRWNLEPFDERLKRELRSWLLDRLETPEYWDVVGVTSAAKLADRVRQDARFMEVAAVYTGQPDFDVTKLVADLVAEESVPFLPVHRYAESGLRKRAQWEETWRLQRQEDAIDARVELPEGDPQKLTPDAAKALKAQVVGAIPVPPKYVGADFRAQSYWRLRGKLDVPKERFVSYPGCERSADGSLPIAWAGWDHAQQARALGAYYMTLKGEEGSESPKLVPLLAGLLELLPWVRKWHPGLDPESGVELAPFYESFVDGEARSLGLTVEQVRAWTPPAGGRAAHRPRARKSIG